MKNSKKEIVFRPMTLRRIRSRLNRNEKLMSAGKSAADAAVKSGLFSFAETARKIRSRNWVIGYAFFMRLFGSCSTISEAEAALEAFDLHPPKCPKPIMFAFRQFESEMMTCVS